MKLLLNYPIYSDSLENCIGSILASINSVREANFHLSTNEPYQEARACQYAACINPHSYIQAQKDPNFHMALLGSKWLIPDGVGILLASRILGGTICKRITGYDLFTSLSSAMNNLGDYRIFLLGANQDTLNCISKRMTFDYPHLKIAGSYSPPFKSEFSEKEIADMVSAVNQSAADVLWVAMTAPKQEKFLLEVQHRLNVPFAAPIGAVFDYYAGNIIQPSRLFRNLGLEWLPRLIQEPKRLYNRMVVSAPLFILAVIKEWFKK